MPRKPGQDTATWIKGIQRLAGLPGNQSPAIVEILNTPTPIDPHPGRDVPTDTPVVERQVLEVKGEKGNGKKNTNAPQATPKATDSNDTQRGRNNR